ncbi:accessory Sec system translocase SecA2 [Paenibacillus alvei]|uniref:accessory Sec system translocase SecA2 n=1 Tax=Paenibacillus alvei TaxID=44250 RepID=UPI00227E44D7|nr:accessory Sec system translocase SecA2 [Paenibacillus alvei]
MRSKWFERWSEKYRNRKLMPYLEQVREMRKLHAHAWSDSEINQRAKTMKMRVREGVASARDVIEAAGLVDEAVWRVKGFRLYDVQWLAGMALHEGCIIEMQTGEGKTLAAVLPAFLQALSGRGVHVLTFNDYLANRDAEWTRPIYEYLGVTVGCITEGRNSEDRKRAYAADITYLTAKQAGYDYLKDSLARDTEQLVQRPFHVALVDEADSILLDEARVPLVIAGEMRNSNREALAYAGIVKQLVSGVDYETDKELRNVYTTNSGIDKVEATLGCGNLYEDHNINVLTMLQCALHAEALLKRNVHYMVRDGRVQLIDELTGRIAQHRHWPDGLQAAVEAKEGLDIRANGQILGIITLQHLLHLYPKKCGMTATAQLAAQEFMDMYGFQVISIPPNKTSRRVDDPHTVFTHRAAKQQAIVDVVESVHRTGRPILIGTSSVEESNQYAEALQKGGVACQVLNAYNDWEEAVLIAKAGMLGAVTVSTNMAGRGVDIVLGSGSSEDYKKIVSLGGLYVIGTNVHENARIDKQLRGRAGRQGDPGTSRYMISLEDDLFIRYGLAEVLPNDLLARKQDEPLNDSRILQLIEHVQRVVDGQHLDMKKTLNKYADLLEQQRMILFNRRNEILHGRQIPNIIANYAPERYELLCEKFGVPTVHSAERQVLLAIMDQCWADHLAYVAYVKEGIHLESLGNNNPLDEYNRLVIAAFEQIDGVIVQRVLDHFSNIDSGSIELYFNDEDLKIPSATWTYTITDQFFPNRVQLL